MATFEQIWPELLGRIPALDPAYAPKLIQRAWTDIRDARPWSFLIGNGILFSPAVITAGSVSVTQFSTAVTFDATARAALNGLTNPVITLRQFRVSGGPIYTMTPGATFAADGIGALDRLYLEATGAASAYQIYRCYYGAPMAGSDATETADFLRYRAIYNPGTLQRFALYGTVEELNIRDPKRVTSGNPCAMYTHSLTTGAFYEMHPHPLAAQSHICTYQKRGADLATGESLPAVIPDEMVLERAMALACMWAESAKGRIKELQGTNWLALSATHNALYADRLREVSLRDEDTLRQNGIFDDLPYSGYGWPFRYSPTMPNGSIALW